MRVHILQFERSCPVIVSEMRCRNGVFSSASIEMTLEEAIEIGKKAQEEKDRREKNIKEGREWYAAEKS